MIALVWTKAPFRRGLCSWYDQEMKKLPIPGYPKYAITEEGAVYNSRTGNPLATSRNRDGYHKVNLYSAPKTKHTKYIHNLVAETFLGPKPDTADLVRHMDGDKDNNAVSNLKYGTYRDNMKDAVRHGTWRGGSGNGLLGEWQVRKTHCPRGHEYTPENTRLCRRGWRNCRTCERMRARRSQA